MTLRDSAGCEANALDLKHKFVNMIKDPVLGRWQPYSQPRMKAVLEQWINSTVVVAVTDEHVDKNTIRACLDNPDWRDKEGDSCADYEQKNYCSSVGKEGEEWKGGADEGLEHSRYATVAAGSAGDACCTCGGGYYDDPFANIPEQTTTTTTKATMPEPMPEPVPEPEAPAPEPNEADSDAEEPLVEPVPQVGTKSEAPRMVSWAASFTGLVIAAFVAS